jgi:alkanesulfonate monooxygenase SsuD/methylene tetrahydromethanopterin reductase-like flavin-dependent oxidoreductase (luciferase family)
VRSEQVNGPRAIAYLEQYWGRDLSAYDPDGPLPDIEPSADALDPSRGTIAIERRAGKLELIESWRDLAAERGLSIRQLVLEVSGGQATFAGTPGQIADTWAHYVRMRAVDGFNITPHLLPASLADIVDKVVPELQDRGVYPAEYAGTTLREHLALPPIRPAEGASRKAG